MKWRIGSDGEVEAMENPPARMELEVQTSRCLLYYGANSLPARGEFLYALDDNGFVELHFYEFGNSDPVFRIGIGTGAFCEMASNLSYLARKACP